jgi:hypothetical protein
LTIGSISLALVLIISAYSFASDYRDGRKRTMRLIAGVPFFAEDETIEFNIYNPGKSESVGMVTFEIIAIGIIDAEGACSKSFETRIKFLPGFNSFTIRKVETSTDTELILDFLTGEDTLVLDDQKCFSEAKRLAVLFFAPRSTVKKNAFTSLSVSVVDRDGRSIAIDVQQARFDNLVPTLP